MEKNRICIILRITKTQIIFYSTVNNYPGTRLNPRVMMSIQQQQILHIGLDIGSVSAKLAIATPQDDNALLAGQLQKCFLTPIDCVTTGRKLYISEPVKVLGEPLNAARHALEAINELSGYEMVIQVTGSQGSIFAELLACPYINEFRAIGRGVVQIVPQARTILEIGGDKSRYLRVSYDEATENLSILDYNRNGECAAGTGSFIDQQAERLKLDVADIGELVLSAQATANIAGRCSVFAKSDMIHAQQRGYSPAAIFKGLCEAVVRNYNGTVLHGKGLEPAVVFVGGVAANSGVVQAMKQILQLQEKELIIPAGYMHTGALGCALLPGGKVTNHAEIINTLKTRQHKTGQCAFFPVLDKSRVRFENTGKLASHINNDGNLQAYLGLDVGSVSTNLVLLDKDFGVIDEVYTRTEGKPVQVVQRELALWEKKWGSALEIVGVGTTGSGRELIGELVGADVVCDEITAHKTGACTIADNLFHEQVDTIFEIGGQDSKYISIDQGIVVDFAMNEACAAGTGSFLEEQASKMGISIKEEFARLAFESRQPIKMGERCTVFMEKDVVAFLQQGYKKTDIAAGLAFAVVQNYINRVVRGRKIGNKIYFQGGTAYNSAVASAFANILGQEIIIPPHNGVIGAIGAALLARTKMREWNVKSRFRGFDLSRVHFTLRNITCKGCSNHCDVQECIIDGEKTYWGDKCSERFRKPRKFTGNLVIPDLIKTYHELLVKDMPVSGGRSALVGYPRTTFYYDRFPFWQTFFNRIGVELLVSDSTNKEIIKKGREHSVAEPCFPIIAAQGHIMELLQKKIDYIFVPNVVSEETETPETESWYCPWEQTIPYIMRAALEDPVYLNKMLIPVIRFRNGMDYIKRTLRPFAKKLGASARTSDRAVEAAYAAQAHFNSKVKHFGVKALAQLGNEKQKAVALLGRPYNLYDAGINLNVPTKLREIYGVNVIPMDFLPDDHIDVKPYHENMFWNYGRRIMQAAVYTGKHKNLAAIYITNFKCGPDSYIRHFIPGCLGSPYLSLQFDDHSNDAGIMTRCEAYLASKNLLTIAKPAEKKAGIGQPEFK